jgi:hypothetical protein
MLIKYNGVAYQRGNMEGTSKLEHKYTISTEENVYPLRIRISYNLISLSCGNEIATRLSFNFVIQLGS